MSALTPASMERCRSCKFYQETSVFELCMHASSAYFAAGRHAHHTTTHMRTAGSCRGDAQHYQPK